MPTVKEIKSDGKAGGSVVLDESIFAAKVNPTLMHQAVLAEMTNRRQDTRDTKTRAEVAGGGKKPYRQKGTGRARQGSITAPHYRHGGIVFGPHPRDLHSKLPRKAKRVAIASALSVRAAEDAIVVLDSLTMDTVSTKQAAALLKTIGAPTKVMIVLSEHDQTIHRSFRNIPGVIVRVAPAFSVRDILDSTQVIMVKSALETLKKTLGGEIKEAVAK